jgi:molybdate transport system ATP-binding protein
VNGLRASVRLPLGEFRLDLVMSAPARGVTALFGASGAGKTMALRCIAGLARAPQGLVSMDGECWQDESRGIFMPPHKRDCGFVFQEASLFPHFSVLGNLRYGWARVPRRARRFTLERTVELLGIGPLLERRPATLSGGERQRVAIARAVLASPRLLLMDEPLASLDAARKAELLGYIERLRDEMQLPIVYVSHAIDEVVRLAETLVVMSGGSVLASGSVVDLASRLDLRPYLGRFEAGSVIEARVAGHDPAYGLTRLRFDGGELLAPDVGSPEGERLRVRIRARDVSLALSRPRDASFLNILHGTVVEIEAGAGPSADVVLAVGAVRLAARITRKSIDTLGLAPGKPVYALVKSVAIDRHSVGYS